VGVVALAARMRRILSAAAQLLFAVFAAEDAACSDHLITSSIRFVR